MAKVVGVSFRKSGRVYYFDPDVYTLSEGDRVIVETIRGLEMGKVIFTDREINIDFMEEGLKKVVRPATNEDLISLYQKKIMSRRALKICKNKIKEYNLEMKLIDVEYAFDDSKIIFYFSADGRIDFRNLVKELAVIFKKRIELHQIGVRDEAKILGAVGLCGRPVCCSVFMPEFVPVSIKMAKEQSLSLNPERISGVCGRFMCCLKHEYDVYHEGLDTYPPVGSFVNTDKGKLKVVEQCIAKDSVICETLEQERIEIPLKKIPEFAKVVEAKTTPDYDLKIKEIQNIKKATVKEANLFAKEAINLLSNLGLGSVISSDDLDKVENKEENKVENKAENQSVATKKEKFRILISPDMIKSNFSSSDNTERIKENVKKPSKIKISPMLSKEKFAGTWSGVSSGIIEHDVILEEEKQDIQKEDIKDDVILEDEKQDIQKEDIKNDVILEEEKQDIQKEDIKDDVILEDEKQDMQKEDIKDDVILEDEKQDMQKEDIKDDVILEDEKQDTQKEDIKNDVILEEEKQDTQKEDIKDDVIIEEEKQDTQKFERKFKPRSEKRGFQPRNPFLRRNQRNNRNEYNDKRNDYKGKYDKRDNEHSERSYNNYKTEHNDRNVRKNDRNEYSNHRNEQRNDQKFSKHKNFWLKGNNKKNNRREEK